uniref:Uncharacterized protein n=1 Tax=Arundo donax TaxID=35708 RepID=A0A0A9DDV2_ARUDO
MKSNSSFAMSISISSLSLSARTTTTPPPILLFAIASCFRREPSLSLHPRTSIWLISITSLFPLRQESTFSDIASDTSPSIVANTSMPPELIDMETILGPRPTWSA